MMWILWYNWFFFVLPISILAVSLKVLSISIAIFSWLQPDTQVFTKQVSDTAGVFSMAGVKCFVCTVFKQFAKIVFWATVFTPLC